MYAEAGGRAARSSRPRQSFVPVRGIRIACANFLIVASLSCDSSAQRPSARNSGGEGPESVVSASRLYREFNENPIDAAARYQGKTVVLEGLVGQIVSLDRGEAAVHLADGGSRIAIAHFPRQDDLRGVRVGEVIQLQCALDRYEFSTVWLSFCARPQSRGGAPGPENGGSQVPSANLLYREYVANARSASATHDGTVVEIEGVRGDAIELDRGGVAIHIADGGKRNALVATFADASQVAGIEQGERFRLRCRVEKFEYLILWLEGCQISR